MAQHIPLKEEREPKLFRSLRRLVQYLSRDYVWDYLPMHRWEPIMRKEVLKYLCESNTDYVASVRSYTLQDKEWNECKFGGIDLRKDAHIEVHFTSKGKITAVYYPV